MPPPHDPAALAAAAGPDTVLTCTAGVAVHVSRAGAVVRRVLVPGADGEVADVVLGYDETLPYLVSVHARQREWPEAWRGAARRKRTQARHMGVGPSARAALNHPPPSLHPSTRPSHQDGSSPYHGATVGRVANRIAGATLTLEDGTAHPLPSNNGPNCLHGGAVGWDKALWVPAPPSRAPPDPPGGSTLRLEHTSPHGDQGFPGTLAAAVTFTLAADGALGIDFEAALVDGDEGGGMPAPAASTVVSMTQHAYFNLGGHGSGPVNGGKAPHSLTLAADAYTPVTADAIPLPGPPRPVAGTPFDFRTPRDVGTAMAELAGAAGGEPSEASQGGFDHNFCLKDPTTVTSPSYGPPSLAALLAGPPPGNRVLEVWTNAPGVQLYTGNFLGGGDGSGAGEAVGKGGAVYVRHGGLCLETQAPPDAPSRSEWAGAVTVRRGGEPYRHRVEWRFGVGRAGVWA